MNPSGGKTKYFMALAKGKALAYSLIILSKNPEVFFYTTTLSHHFKTISGNNKS